MLTEIQLMKLDLPEGGFVLKHGGVLKEINVAYETCGTLSPDCDNVIFIAHALTGDAHVAGWHAGDTKLTGYQLHYFPLLKNLFGQTLVKIV